MAGNAKTLSQCCSESEAATNVELHFILENWICLKMFRETGTV